jgi:hypothetical protein
MEGREVAWSEVTFNTWAALFHVTIGAGILAYIAWFWALSRGGITRVAPLQFAQPLLALVFAELILHERFSLSLLVTGTVIIAGIVITFRTGRSSGNFAMAGTKLRSSIGLATRMVNASVIKRPEHPRLALDSKNIVATVNTSDPPERSSLDPIPSLEAATPNCDKHLPSYPEVEVVLSAITDWVRKYRYKIGLYNQLGQCGSDSVM